MSILRYPPPRSRPGTRTASVGDSSFARNSSAVSAIPFSPGRFFSLLPPANVDFTINGTISRSFFRTASFTELPDDLTRIPPSSPQHWRWRAARTSRGRRELSFHSREPRRRRRAAKQPQTCQPVMHNKCDECRMRSMFSPRNRIHHLLFAAPDWSWGQDSMPPAIVTFRCVYDE